jgi:hypothetical protein
MRVTFTHHALERLAQRKLERGWVEQVALRPDWTEADAKTGITRHYGVIDAAGGKALRIALVDAS